MEVWSLLKYIVILRKRENLIYLYHWKCMSFTFLFGKPISTILKVINFYKEFTQGFLASNYAAVQSKRKLMFAKAVLYVPSIHSVQ